MSSTNGGPQRLHEQRAQQLAEMGYVAFAADMYGKGVVTDDPTKAGQLAGQFRQNWDTTGGPHARASAGGLAVWRRIRGWTRSGWPRSVLLRRVDGAGTGLQRGGPGRGGDLPRRLTVPRTTICGHQGAISDPPGADDPSIKPETITAMQQPSTRGTPTGR